MFGKVTSPSIEESKNLTLINKKFKPVRNFPTMHEKNLQTIKENVNEFLKPKPDPSKSTIDRVVY